MAPGAAARHQDFDVVGPAQIPVQRRTEAFAEVMIDRHRYDSRRRAHPARIRILLVLLLHDARYRILDLGQARDVARELSLLVRLSDLLRQQGCDGFGPTIGLSAL